MPTKVNVKAKSMINVKRLTFFGFSNEETETYDTTKVYEQTKGTMLFNDNRSYNSTPNYGDGEETDREYSTSGRVVEFQIHDLSGAGMALVHGHSYDSGTGAISRSGDDRIPAVGCAVMTVAPGRKVNLYKYFKVKFPPSSISVTQKTEGNVTFSNTTLSGAYTDLDRLGKDSCIIKGVDPTTTAGAALISSWFTIPDFCGSSSMQNTSTLSANGNTLSDGDTIESGTTVTFTGAASDGQTPYSYSYYYRAVGSDEWTAKAEGTTSSATQQITVATQTDYEFKITATDANGVIKNKSWVITVAPGS